MKFTKGTKEAKLRGNAGCSLGGIFVGSLHGQERILCPGAVFELVVRIIWLAGQILFGCKDLPRKMKIFHLVACAAFLVCLPAQAAITLSFEYDTVSNVTTASWSGTWDVSYSFISAGSGIETASEWFYAYEDAFTGNDNILIPGPYPWSTTRSDWTISPSSDPFGFDEFGVYGPAGGFTPATVIAGSMFRTGNLTDLGFADNSGGLSGTLSGTGGTVNWSTSAIPEPSTYAALVAQRRGAFLCRSPRRA